MISFAQAMTDAEIRAAAEYYAAMPWTPWIRVVETNRVPRTTISAGMFLPNPGADEPLGQRIIEVPEDAETVEIQRDPRTGFIAYVPAGGLKRGEELVTTGAGGRTVMCAACHGPEFKGMTLPEVGAIPGLAGRSPSYIVRQLFDLKQGARNDKRAEFMKPVVANLSTDDMLAIAAYLASRTP